jgi:hypothetical protein
MLAIIIIILGTAFVLYTVLGGADFGAGIIETVCRGERRTNDIKSHGTGVGSQPCVANTRCRNIIYWFSIGIFFSVTSIAYTADVSVGWYYLSRLRFYLSTL